MTEPFAEVWFLICLTLTGFGFGVIVGTYRAMAEIKKSRVFKSKHFEGVFSFDAFG